MAQTATPAAWVLGEKIDGSSADVKRKVHQDVLWATYRRSIPLLLTDKGWGCTVRSMQMLLINAFMRASKNSPRESRLADVTRDRRVAAGMIIDWECTAAVFSLNRLMRTSNSIPGKWFGPHEAASMMIRESPGPSIVTGSDGGVPRSHSASDGDADIVRALRIIICNDGIVVKSEVTAVATARTLDAVSSTITAPPPLTTADAGDPSKWQPTLAIIPCKLGLDRADPLYLDLLCDLMRMSAFAGGVGGSPRHSVFFVGVDSNKDFLCLDPHTVQDCPPPLRTTACCQNEVTGVRSPAASPPSTYRYPSSSFDFEPSRAVGGSAAASVRLRPYAAAGLESHAESIPDSFVDTLTPPSAAPLSMKATSMDPTISLGFFFPTDVSFETFCSLVGRLGRSIGSASPDGICGPPFHRLQLFEIAESRDLSLSAELQSVDSDTESDSAPSCHEGDAGAGTGISACSGVSSCRRDLFSDGLLSSRARRGDASESSHRADSDTASSCSGPFGDGLRSRGRSTAAPSRHGGKSRSAPQSGDAGSESLLARLGSMFTWLTSAAGLSNQIQQKQQQASTACTLTATSSKANWRQHHATCVDREAAALTEASIAGKAASIATSASVASSPFVTMEGTFVTHSPPCPPPMSRYATADTTAALLPLSQQHEDVGSASMLPQCGSHPPLPSSKSSPRSRASSSSSYSLVSAHGTPPLGSTSGLRRTKHAAFEPTSSGAGVEAGSPAAADLDCAAPAESGAVGGSATQFLLPGPAASITSARAGRGCADLRSSSGAKQSFRALLSLHALTGNVLDAPVVPAPRATDGGVAPSGTGCGRSNSFVDVEWPANKGSPSLRSISAPTDSSPAAMALSSAASSLQQGVHGT